MRISIRLVPHLINLPRSDLPCLIALRSQGLIYSARGMWSGTEAAPRFVAESSDDMAKQTIGG
jgi:hypothetical protein